MLTIMITVIHRLEVDRTSGKVRNCHNPLTEGGSNFIHLESWILVCLSYINNEVYYTCWLRLTKRYF